jgi:hypothetical protein
MEKLCFYVVRAERLQAGQCEELSSVVRRWSASHGVSAEAEESPLLEAVTRKRPLESVTD